MAVYRILSEYILDLMDNFLMVDEDHDSFLDM